jgi:hypothetical protein
MLAKLHRDNYFVDLITGISNAVFAVDGRAKAAFQSIT